MANFRSGQGFGGAAPVELADGEPVAERSDEPRGEPVQNTPRGERADFSFLLEFVDDPKTYTATAIAANVTQEVRQISDAAIRTRWMRWIARAIGADRVRSGSRYTSLFNAACLSYARYEELFPGESPEDAQQMWISGVAAALSVRTVTPEVVGGEPFSTADGVVIQGGAREVLVQESLAPVTTRGGALEAYMQQIGGQSMTRYEQALDITAEAVDSAESLRVARLRLRRAQGRQEAVEEFMVKEKARADMQVRLQMEAEEVELGNAAGVVSPSSEQSS